MQNFLREYENSAERLQAFGIYLGLVDCLKHHISSYCNDERSLHYAFGFKNGLEKIALPLDTLFDVDSIVASALHLSLIHNVPIIQTLSERKSLEMKCKEKYNIVFSYQRALGTKEHRVFMELAYTFLDKYVFAMTILESAVQDLRQFKIDVSKYDDSDRYSRMEPTLWVIYCQFVTNHDEECSQNYYYGRFIYLDVFHFVQSLDAPRWVEFSNRSMEEHLPYNPSEIHLLYVVINNSDEQYFDNVVLTHKYLGQLFAGSVGIVFIRVTNASDDGLLKLGLPTRKELESKLLAFAWKSKGQNSLEWKEDSDDLQQFIIEHLRSGQNTEIIQLDHELNDNRIWDEYGEELSEQLIELQQDDMVAEFVRQSVIDTSQLTQISEADFQSTLENNSLSLILFYVDWDPNCQVTMQHMVEVRRHLESVNDLTKRPPLLAKLNCFDWPKLCQSNDITKYPTIKIFIKENNDIRSYTYGGLIDSKSILSALKLYEAEVPTLLNSEEDALKFCNGIWPIVSSTSSIKLNFVILFGFSSTNHMEGILLANKLSKSLIGKSLIGYTNDQLADQVGRHFKVEVPFLILCKPNDPFKSFVAYDKAITSNTENNSLNSIKEFIQNHQLDSFAELTVDNFPAYRQQPDKDLIIFFSSKQNVKDDTAWNRLGMIAASNHYPDLLFAWMKTDDKLTKNLLAFYKICSMSSAAVRIYFQKGTYSVIPGVELESGHSIEKFLDGTLQSNAMHSDKLLVGDWKPLHPGFDYLRLIDEDTELNQMDLQSTEEYNYKSDNRDTIADINLKDTKRGLVQNLKAKEDAWDKMTNSQKEIHSEL
ncbi:hypothetical protein CHUAL_010064 [Chamberlinius hualienensis]